MKLTLIVLILILICCAGGTVNAQSSVSTEKEQAIRRLLVLTKAGDLGTQFIEQAMAQMRAQFSGLPPDMKDRVIKISEEEMRKDFSGEKIVEATVPIYDKYMSLDDVKQLIAFYETPIGQKLISVLPQITREAFDDGIVRGRITTQRILARLRNENVLPSSPDEQPKPQPASRRAPQRARRRH